MGASDVEILEESEGDGILRDDRTLGEGRILGGRTLGEGLGTSDVEILAEQEGDRALGEGRTLGDLTGGVINRGMSSEVGVLAELEIVAKAAISIIA